MTDSFTRIDGAVLLTYFLATMSIGFYFYRKTRTTAGFTAASRSLPGWACGLSIFATYLSSISFLALPGKAFASNWNPFVFSLSLPIATIVAAYVFMPYYRKSGEVSTYAHLEHRFGPWARLYTGIYGDAFTLYADHSHPPQINGTPVNYAPSKAYDSPFLKADWNSGVVHIQKGSRSLVLDFTGRVEP